MTKLIYLKDTYLFEDWAEVLEIKETERGLAVILDQTIFYPQGGGQPADHGEIVFENDGGSLSNSDSQSITGDGFDKKFLIFEVSDVRLDQDGTVYHFGEFKDSKVSKTTSITTAISEKSQKTEELKTNLTNFKKQKVQLKIDQERRLTNAKNHTAGHLIDIAIHEMGLHQLKPHKGFHFPEGPYCEFRGSAPQDPEERQKVAQELEKICAQLIEQDLKIFAEELTEEEAKSRNLIAPPGKSVRFVYFQNYEKLGMGCGGTHTRSTKEVGAIQIRQIKEKKGIVKVKYVVESFSEDKLRKSLKRSQQEVERGEVVDLEEVL